MRSALSILLNGPIYHMYEVVMKKSNDHGFWTEICQAKKSNEEWKEFMQGRGYRGGVDYPPSLFYKEQMEAFPEAKVILTIREPEAWYKSVKETIYQGNMEAKKFPMNVLGALTGRSKFSTMLEALTTRSGNRFNDGMFDVIGEGKEASVQYFNDWVGEVKRTVPQDKLLVFNVKEGWEPLCAFLNLPVPDVPFPNTNDSKTMKARFRKGKIISYLLVLGFPTFLAASAFYFFQFWLKN